MALTVIGVRHHSPACARLVQSVLTAQQPRWVLIEGPADFNDRLGELTLDHEPPVALFSYHFQEDRRYASWAPFCAHSPEWVGLRQGFAQGAEVRFIDLPGWAHEMEGIENRYADGVLADPQPLLEQATGQQGYDAVWDACFEIPEVHDLAQRLEVYFRGIRDCQPASPSDLGRERYMAQWVRWALDQGGDVVVICGGFHAPVLAKATEVDPQPKAPSITHKPDSRAATWLIPFDHPRLDSFGGYASGLPSPAWYDWVWEHGPQHAARLALQHTSQTLRHKGQVVSVADTVAAWTQAQALARLRAHDWVARTDLLDAVTSTWVKEALDEPVPWSRREVLGQHTHPVLVALLRTLCGNKRGTLAPDTPLPPLVGHLNETLEDHDLVPGEAREVTVDHQTRDRHITLERLVLLSIAGFGRVSSDRGRHTFVVQSSPAFESTVLEAASYGPTLEAAGAALLEERATTAEGFLALVGILQDSLRAALPTLSHKALSALRLATSQASDLGDLGRGLQTLLGLIRHAGLTKTETGLVQVLCDAAVDRVLWIAEGLQGEGTVDRGRVMAIMGVRDAALHTSLDLLPARIDAVFSRVANDPGAPSDLRGASLGALASLGFLEVDTAAQTAIVAIRNTAPEHLGDYLAGLLALGREVLVDAPSLTEGIDDAVSGLNDLDFQIALPALRLAFAELPPRERAAIGGAVARRHGKHASLTHRLQGDPLVVAQARVLEQQVTDLLAQFGVSDG